MSDAPSSGRHREFTGHRRGRVRTRQGSGGRARARARALVVAPVLAAAAVGGLAAAGPAGAATTWEELRTCESGGNYSTNTGNGYYGAYQFSLPTWRGLGYTGLPSDAAPAVQDEAALRLAKRSGFGQWPACGRGMGPANLAAGSGHSVSSGTSGAAAAAAGRPHFTTALAGQVREDVRSWQAQMNKLGYRIAVDGRYGRESAAAARSLQAAEGLRVDGICGPHTWAATFAG